MIWKPIIPIFMAMGAYLGIQTLNAFYFDDSGLIFGLDILAYISALGIILWRTHRQRKFQLFKMKWLNAISTRENGTTQGPNNRRRRW